MGGNGNDPRSTAPRSRSPGSHLTDSLLLAGGEVLTVDGMDRLDVRVRDGRVVELGTSLDGRVDVDCTGCWVGPGFVDLHTHLREPGQEHKEDMTSGGAAASAGGYTALLAMPNTNPAIDTADRAAWALRRGREVPNIDIAVAGAVTAGRAGQRLADLDGMLEQGVRWFTDDGDSVSTSGLLRAALERLGRHDARISEHAEDASLTAGAVMHAGEVSELLGVPGMPASAEAIIIARDLALVREIGTPLHVQHVSTTEAVELVAQAKSEGLPVTAEATPHHLMFDHTELKGRDPRFKMKPPLRTAFDVQAVQAALSSGIIDAVATDHAPHSREETEEVGLERAAFGVIGLETAAAAVNTAVELPGSEFFDRLSVAPARLGGFTEHGNPVGVGMAANLVVFDPGADWIPQQFRSRSRNSPFTGRRLRGRVRVTLFRGAVAFESGAPDV